MRNPAIVIAAFWILSLLSGATTAQEIWVFTAAGAPALSGLDRVDRHFVLHRDELTLDGLAFPDPGDADAARRMALAQIQSPHGKALLAQIKANSEARLMAFMHGIERLPAVLVDGTYVAYGGGDVQTAVNMIAAYRRRAGR